MNRKKHIICLATRPWDGLPHRTRYLMSRLKEVEILYYYPSQTTTAPWKNNRRSQPKGRFQVRPGIYAYPLPWEMQLDDLFSLLRQKRVARFLTQLLTRHRVSRPLLWVTHPAYGGLSARLNPHYLVYDCGQLWDSNLFFAQEQLVASADLVFAASPSLRDGLRTLHHNVALLENGVNSPLYVASAPLPPQAENWFGFVGVISRDLDLSPLLYVAQEMPQWQFFLLGPAPGGNPYLRDLSTLENVHFFGEKSPLEVPEFLMNCRVLMDFQRRNHPTQDINTIRLYEYFATGRPIVANLQPGDIERYPDVIYSAYSPQDFLEQCQLALGEDPNFVFARRKHYGEEASWTNRADQVMQILKSGGIL